MDITGLPGCNHRLSDRNRPGIENILGQNHRQLIHIVSIQAEFDPRTLVLNRSDPPDNGVLSDIACLRPNTDLVAANRKSHALSFSQVIGRYPEVAGTTRKVGRFPLYRYDIRLEDIVPTDEPGNEDTGRLVVYRLRTVDLFDFPRAQQALNRLIIFPH